jgi:hypothetical protein
MRAKKRNLNVKFGLISSEYLIIKRNQLGKSFSTEITKANAMAAKV